MLVEGPPAPGDRVLYWMQAAQRAHGNPALEHAILLARGLDLPVLVVLGLASDFPEANRRHYRFMLEGLREVRDSLRERGILLVVRRGSPDQVAREAAQRAAVVVVDRGYLRVQEQWRRSFLAGLDRPVVQVEGEVVVPLETASGKAEFAARTLRPRIHRNLDRFLVPMHEQAVERTSLGLEEGGVDLDDLEGLLEDLGVDGSAPPVAPPLRGGTKVARAAFERFLSERLARYVQNRNQPQEGDVSGMGPYLHFGQISPVELALRTLDVGRGADLEAFLEQLVVRRELAANFVRYTAGYDRYEEAVPEWARRTLAAHAPDPRVPCYTLEDLEAARTHDRYWNAAMREMILTGTMHNAMRMYWGKKVLEWSPTPELAFRWLLALNNRYFLDGRDPNSFAGVAWIFGRHDRPWGERAIYGTVRCMMASGLERKGDPEAYVRKVEALEAAARGW